MTAFARTDVSIIGKWWWTVDRWMLAAIVGLIAFGLIMALAASPSIAERYNLDYFYFARRQLIYVPVAVVAMLGASLLSPQGVLRAAVIVLLVFAALVVATFFIGTESRGARRWISLGFLSMQPSEFIKPAFAVVAAWLFAASRTGELPVGNLVSIGLFGMLIGMLLLQPDVGMSIIIAAVWSAQFFLAGLPVFWVMFLLVLGVGLMITAYGTLPHVASRIDRFLDPSSGNSYQIDRSLEAFVNGGLLGRGPGEGTVKWYLPDAHSDFVFAVAGEEFGVLTCLVILLLFVFVLIRSMSRILQTSDLFVFVAASGLMIQFGLQAIINMGSTLRLLPTKGMTLPFVSYGGSSLIAMGLCVGFLLALTRRRPAPGV